MYYSRVSMSHSDCIFCAVVANQAPAKVVRRWPESMAIVPLNPVVDGHVIVLPNAHIDDAGFDPALAGLVAMRAASYGATNYGSFNLITSVGRAATQSIFHLHWHVVPRWPQDGLKLPWSAP